jgi:hypothetical protein
MQTIRLLMLIALSAASASCHTKTKDLCERYMGADESVPAVVIDFMERKFPNDQLIDKVDCQKEVMWIAIPKKQSPTSLRNPGVGTLVRFDKETHEVTSMDGE